MTNNTLYRRKDAVSETPVDDESFLVVPETEAIFHLNALGRALWTLLEAPHGTDDIQALMASAFPETPAETLAADIRQFMAIMLDTGLIEETDGK